MTLRGQPQGWWHHSMSRGLVPERDLNLHGHDLRLRSPSCVVRRITAGQRFGCLYEGRFSPRNLCLLTTEFALCSAAKQAWSVSPGAPADGTPPRPVRNATTKAVRRAPMQIRLIDLAQIPMCGSDGPRRADQG